MAALNLGACEDNAKRAAQEQEIAEQSRKVQEQAWEGERARAAQEKAAHELELNEQARAAQQQALVDAKAALRANPTRFLKLADIGVYDKGIINSYRQLTRLSLLNASDFAVTDVRGEVDWVDAAGNRIGSTVVALAGSIPAGDTKTFSTADGTLQSGTLQGNATTQSVRFTSVTIVEASNVGAGAP
jgi:hypothetical protein